MKMRNLFILVLLFTLLCPTVIIASEGPGLVAAPLITQTHEKVGIASVWNTGDKFQIRLDEADSWQFRSVKIYVGNKPVPATRKGNLIPGKFTYKQSCEVSEQCNRLVLDLEDDLGFMWGTPYTELRLQNIAIHVGAVKIDADGSLRDSGAAWAYTGNGASTEYGEFDEEYLDDFEGVGKGWWFSYMLSHPMRGQFIDAPVQGLSYSGPTQQGITGYDEDGAVSDQGGFSFFPNERITFSIGSVPLGTARAGKKVSPLDLYPGADVDDPSVNGVARVLQSLDANQSDGKIVLLPEVVGCFEDVVSGRGLSTIDYDNATLVDSLINEAVQVCNGVGGAELLAVSASEAEANLVAGLSASGIFRKNVSKTADMAESNQKLEVMPVYFPGVRSNGDPSFCDQNDNNEYDEGEEGVPYEEWRLNGDPLGEECDPRVDGDTCEVTLIECREVAKPIISAYMEQIDLFDDSVTTDFYPDRFAYDIVSAISRDDGATWKRMNVSRMGDLSSFNLETGEPFHGTCNKPQLKVLDNKMLLVWVSSFARGGNPRYAINLCDDPETAETETPETGCAVYCRGDAEQGTEVCEPDYPYDDEYYVEDIWGVRGQQSSVNYNEVDDVAELGIGEIPYSALWAARGVILTQADLNSGKFASLSREDDPTTPDVDESVVLEVGGIVWFKPERLTSARRDAYIPVVGATRGAGFAIAWQEDPEGLRPGKGKGPGQGWSGAISNHKTDIWYSFIRIEDFDQVDANFIPGGTPDEDRPGVGRPKALVPFSLPVRVSDNDMLNTDTLKVELGETGLPEIVDGTYTPIDPLTVEHGNAVGTKRYAYLAKTDSRYEYYWENLDLCDTSGANSLTEVLPDSSRPRWYGFTNTEGSYKTVCIASDGRLIDGDVSASRANISLQPYTKSDGTKSAWVLLAYEESKGMGHSLDAGHDDAELITESGQDKPIKQDLGKNVIYHSFDFTEPDLVAPGHIVNLPALCGGLYPDWCDDLSNPTCSCTPGQPVPLYFETQNADGAWVPTTDFLQYRTEIARRTRFIAQSKSKVKDSGLIAAIIYKQGQEGQGRPADVFIRRIVVPPGDTGNPYKYENIECKKYLDEGDFELPTCNDGTSGYNCNVWGEKYGDRLCGGIYSDAGYERRDHVNLTSADIDLKVDAGPDDDTPDDPTDDVYGTEKVLLWSQYDYNLGNESYGVSLTDNCDEISCAGMYSNARSHRGFIRGDFLVAAYAYSPNWAAARNGNDRYNFYIRKSFDGGESWTTTPSDLGGIGINYCPEWRSDPTVPDIDGSGNAPPEYDGFDPDCVDWCPPCPDGETCDCTVTGVPIAAGDFQPAIKVSEFDNNKETSSDPRVGATPPVPPLDGRDPALPVLRFVEDEYVNNIFFVAWGAGDNAKSTGGMSVTPEAPPTDVYYTRSTDYGDTFLKVPWNVNPQGNSDNWETGELVWRYERLAWGDPEQGECQIRATSDGSKMYGVYHQLTPAEEDPDEPITRWYPWEPAESTENDVWFRRVIFWPDEITTP